MFHSNKCAELFHNDMFLKCFKCTFKIVLTVQHALNAGFDHFGYFGKKYNP